MRISTKRENDPTFLTRKDIVSFLTQKAETPHGFSSTLSGCHPSVFHWRNVNGFRRQQFQRRKKPTRKTANPDFSPDCKRLGFRNKQEVPRRSVSGSQRFFSLNYKKGNSMTSNRFCPLADLRRKIAVFFISVAPGFSP